MELESRSGARAELERSSNGAQNPERSTGLQKDARLYIHKKNVGTLVNSEK